MKIIAEVENTKSGTIAVVENDNGTFSVGYLKDDDTFDVRHPEVNAKGAINALAHYFNAEMYSKITKKQ